MSDLLQLVQIGRDLGLQDEALREFVSTEQARLRDERQAEREATREKEDRRLKREKEARAHAFALEELRLKAAVEEARARAAGDTVTVVESYVEMAPLTYIPKRRRHHCFRHQVRAGGSVVTGERKYVRRASW